MFKLLFCIVLGWIAYTYVISPEAKASLGHAAAEFIPSPIASVPENPIAVKRLDAAKQRAWIMAQYFVKKKLAHPGTADFNAYEDGINVLEPIDKDTFPVFGVVTSENKLGNSVKNEFRFVIKNYGNGDWRVLSPILMKEIK